jgi:hypothetical protein
MDGHAQLYEVIHYFHLANSYVVVSPSPSSPRSYRAAWSLAALEMEPGVDSGSGGDDDDGQGPGPRAQGAPTGVYKRTNGGGGPGHGRGCIAI